MARRDLSLGNRADGASAVLEFDVCGVTPPVVQPRAVNQPADPPNLIRIAPVFPPEVLDTAEQIRARGGEIISFRWVNEAIELRFFRRAGAAVEAPRMTFFPAEMYAHLRLESELDADEEIPVLPDEVAIAATAERDARHAELEAAGVIVLARYSVGNR